MDTRKHFAWFLKNSWGPDKALVEDNLKLAFSSWTRYVDISFEQVSDKSKANIFIGFYANAHNCGKDFDGPKGKLAHATTVKYDPNNLFIHFDSDESWDMEPELSFSKLLSSRPVFCSVAIHEIGHIIGLLHNRSKFSVMYKFYNKFIDTPDLYDLECLSKMYVLKQGIQHESNFVKFIKINYTLCLGVAIVTIFQFLQQFKTK